MAKRSTKKVAKPLPAGVGEPGQPQQALVVHDPVKVKLAELNFAPYNPRVMPPDKMVALKASLIEHGVVLNFVVQKQSAKYGPMVIIGGHQRVTAAREVCKEKGWPMPEHGWGVIKDVDDFTARKLNIALNNIEGEFDPYKVGEMFRDYANILRPEDVLAMGYDNAQMAEFIALVQPPPDGPTLTDMPEFSRSVTLSLEFDTVANRDAAKSLLTKLAKDQTTKPGNLVYQMLKAQHAVGNVCRKVRSAAI
jgi:ParB-like chromosome segregation protein Spo0J